MKFIIKLFKDRFKQKNQTRWLLINTDNQKTNWPYIDAYFTCVEFGYKKEAIEFLKNNVAKSERNNWKLYKETNLKESSNLSVK